MKPARFEYSAPQTLDEALALLDEGARPLAGGQSLVPLLNARLVRPRRIVDLNRIPGLDYLREDESVLRIGLLTRQAALERLDGWPLLREAALHVGLPATRNRGTVCGSVANAAPAGELPAAFAALDARFVARSARGSRSLTAAELFVGPYRTALEPDELLVEIEVPAHPAHWSFAEYARTRADWPLVGAAVAGNRIGLFGVASTPVVVGSVDELREAVADEWKREYLRQVLS